MRLKPEQAAFLKNAVLEILPDAEVRLFGSRVDDSKRGGDIDLLVIAGRRLTLQERIQIQVAFWKKFGEQKIDIATFERDEDSAFKELALMDSILL